MRNDPTALVANCNYVLVSFPLYVGIHNRTNWSRNRRLILLRCIISCPCPADRRMHRRPPSRQLRRPLDSRPPSHQLWRPLDSEGSHQQPARWFHRVPDEATPVSMDRHKMLQIGKHLVLPSASDPPSHMALMNLHRKYSKLRWSLKKYFRSSIVFIFWCNIL